MAADEPEALADRHDSARDSFLPAADDRVLPREHRREVHPHGVRSNAETAPRAGHVRRAGARSAPGSM
jgi:hypothetical protein